jgi:hypothetical protein
MVTLHQVGVCELLLFVVLLNKVLNDGSRLPQDQPRVRILDGGIAPVGIDIRKRLFLHVFEFEGLDLIWHVKLFEDDNNFPGIRTRGFAS